MRRNGRPYAVGIMPIVVASFAALAVGYGLGEQAQLGEQEARDYIEHVTWGRWQITPLGEIVAKQLAKKGNR